MGSQDITDAELKERIAASARRLGFEPSPPEPPDTTPWPTLNRDDLIPGDEYGLTKGQRVALIATLEGHPLHEVRRIAGISTRTLSRWRSGERGGRFREALTAANEDAIRDAKTQFQRALPMAAAAVIEIVSDPGAKSSDRLRAAELLLARAGWPAEQAEGAGVQVTINAGEIQNRMKQIWGGARTDVVEVEALPADVDGEG